MNTQYNKIFSLFRTWLNDQEYYSTNTKEPYLRIIRNFLDYLDGFDVCNLNNVNKELLLKFITKRGDKKYAQAYINLRESALDLFYAWANRNKYCRNNPVLDCRKAKLHLKPFPKKPNNPNTRTITVLNTKEQQQLLDSITEIAKTKNDFTATRNKCIINLILASALYATELINLYTGDIDLKNSSINVRGNKNKKRRVQINFQAKLICEEWLAVRTEFLQNKKSLVLFFTDDLKPITKRTLYRIISKAMLDAELNKNHLGPEVLRQTAICNMLSDGMSLEDAQEVTGISTLAILEKYYDLIATAKG